MDAVALPNTVYESLKDLVIEALLRIKQLRSLDSTPVKVSPTLSITGRGEATLVERIEPDLSILAITVEREVTNAASFDTFRDSIEADATTGKGLNVLMGTTESRQRWTPEDVFGIALWRYLKLSESSEEFRSSIFDAVCDELWQSLTSPTVTLHFMSFLEYAEMEDQEICLGSGITLRKLAPNDVESLWNDNLWIRQHYSFHGPSGSPPTRLQVLLETRQKVPKIVGDQKSIVVDPEDRPPLQVARNFGGVLTAMRILKGGNVRLGPLACTSEGLLSSGTSIAGSSSVSRGLYGFGYKLMSSEVDELKSIWSMLKCPHVRDTRALSVGIRRLNLAAERITLEDTIIDVMIAFEALILMMLEIHNKGANCDTDLALDSLICSAELQMK